MTKANGTTENLKKSLMTLGSGTGPVTGLTLGAKLGQLNLVGDANRWILNGALPDYTTAANTSWQVLIGGVSVQAGALGSALTDTIGAAQASALAAAAGEAKKSFGTESVSKQIDDGFGGDVGVAATMAHDIPLEGETISVAACTTESKNGQPCKK